MKVKKKDRLRYRMVMLSLLLDRLEDSTCVFEKERCRYCLDVVRSGYKEHFNEVLEFLGIERDMMTKKETKTIRAVLKMYEEIGTRIVTMSPIEKNRLTPYLFSGLDEVSQHAYYMFLKRHDNTYVSCDNYLPKNLKEYKTYVKKYETLSQPATFDSLILIFESKKEASTPLHFK